MNVQFYRRCYGFFKCEGIGKTFRGRQELATLTKKDPICRCSLSMMANGSVRHAMITPMHSKTSTGKLASLPPTASSAGVLSCAWTNSGNMVQPHTWLLRVEVDLARRGYQRLRAQQHSAHQHQKKRANCGKLLQISVLIRLVPAAKGGNDEHHVAEQHARESSQTR